MNEKNNGTLLSNLETSHPEMGKPIKELTGIAMSMVPSWASLSSKNDFMLGILDAHDEKQNPERKKKMLRESRCLFFSSMRAPSKVRIYVIR